MHEHDHSPHDGAAPAAERPRPGPDFLHVGVAVLATLLAASVSLVPRRAEAAAWTRPQGEALLSMPVTYTRANEGFDEDGNRVDRRDFEMLEVAPYFEYGVLDDLTFGLQPKFRSVDVETEQGDTVSNSGLAESDVLLRQNLWSQGDAAFSAQGLVKIPIDPQENEQAALGRDQVDAELSLLYGNRHRFDSGTFFYNVGVGYRKRFEGPDDQAKANAFAGWSVSKWTFLVTSDNSVGLKSARDDSEVLTAGPSYTRFEAGLVASYHLTDKVSVSANASTTYAGEQVGAGQSAGLSSFIVW